MSWGDSCHNWCPWTLGFNSYKRTGDMALGPVRAGKEMNHGPRRAAHHERPNWKNICLLSRRGNRGACPPAWSLPQVAVRTASLARIRLWTDVTWRSRNPQGKESLCSVAGFCKHKAHLEAQSQPRPHMRSELTPHWRLPHSAKLQTPKPKTHTWRRSQPVSQQQDSMLSPSDSRITRKTL